MGNKSANYLNNNDVDAVVNEAYALATGSKEITTLTLSDIIDAGTKDGGALVGKKEQFTKALIMAIAKNMFTDTAASEDDDPYYVDSRQWGAITQMISAQAPEVKESSAWREFVSGTSKVGQYTVYLPIVSTKYYGRSSSWGLPIAISYEQYADSFTGAEGFNAFRSYIILVVQNAIKKHRKDMNNANRNNFMAEKYYYATTVRQRGVFEFTITHAAAATDVIVICGHEIKWVANGTTPDDGEVALPSTNNATNEASALATYLNAISSGNETNFTWTSSSGKVIATQDSDAIYARPVTAATKGTTTMEISAVSETTEMKAPKGVHAFLLRSQYNKEMTPESNISSKEAFMKNPDCLRYMNRKIAEYVGYLKEQTALFNTDQLVKFVPEDRLVLEVLNYAEKASESVMQSDAYHDDYVKLPGHRSVSAWEGLGDGNNGSDFAIEFDDISKIDVVIDAEGTSATVQLSGIVAFACDKWAIMHTIRSERVGAQNFDIDALDLYEYQFRDQYMNNLSLPAIVFVVD